MNKNAVGWFEIYVQDMGRAKRFYESVFDRKLEKLQEIPAELEMWGFSGDSKSYGSPGALVKMEGMPSGQNSVLVYFSCDNCEIEEKKAKENGGRIHKSKMSIGHYGYISLVYDCENNLIGLHSMN